MKLNVIIRPGRQDGAVQAYSPDFVGCSATASSEEEAIRLLRERIARIVAESGKQPAPPGTVRRTIEL
jgi:predicted RNase H-like HicB family nuclease